MYSLNEALARERYSRSQAQELQARQRAVCHAEKRARRSGGTLARLTRALHRSR